MPSEEGAEVSPDLPIGPRLFSIDRFGAEALSRYR